MALPSHSQSNVDFDDCPEALCGAIAFAYSNAFNPRSLEALWSKPYLLALDHALEPRTDELQAFYQYPLWIPGIDVEGLRLRRSFRDADMNFELEDDVLRSQFQQTATHPLAAENDPPLNPRASRQLALSRKNEQKKAKEDNKMKEKLLSARKEWRKKTAAAERSKMKPLFHS